MLYVLVLELDRCKKSRKTITATMFMKHDRKQKCWSSLSTLLYSLSCNFLKLFPFFAQSFDVQRPPTVQRNPRECDRIPEPLLPGPSVCQGRPLLQRPVHKYERLARSLPARRVQHRAATDTGQQMGVPVN